MTTLLWIIGPGFPAVGAALLICYMMRCRMEEAVAQERGALAELRSSLAAQRESLPQTLVDAKAEARRAAFDMFLQEFRVEQRQYIHRSKLFFLTRKTLVVEERILFRNLPLCNWVEHRMPLEETAGPWAPEVTIEAGGQSLLQ